MPKFGDVTKSILVLKAASKYSPEIPLVPGMSVNFEQ